MSLYIAYPASNLLVDVTEWFRFRGFMTGKVLEEAILFCQYQFKYAIAAAVHGKLLEFYIIALSDERSLAPADIDEFVHVAAVECTKTIVSSLVSILTINIVGTSKYSNKGSNKEGGHSRKRCN